MYFGFGFSAAVVTWSRIWSTSSALSGVGLRAGADEPGDLRRVLHHVPRVVGHVHLDQDVAGEEPLRRHDLLPPRISTTSSVGMRISPISSCSPYACTRCCERLGHLLLEARVGVDDVPLLRRDRRSCRTKPLEDPLHADVEHARRARRGTRRRTPTSGSRRRSSRRPPSRRPGDALQLVADLGEERRACARHHPATLPPAFLDASSMTRPRSLHPSDQLARRDWSGRPGGNRTPNPRFWRPVLCQLSYWPNPVWRRCRQ